jgi:hypothetical protein
MAKPDPMIKYLTPLVGATITTIIVEDGTDAMDETHYGFIVEKNGKRFDCMILCDPEGNGPGHLDITAKKDKINANK